MKKLHLRNFKAFGDTTELKMAPITVLIGPNSSGKSSLLQPLLMFKQTADSRDINTPLVVNGTYVKLAAFENFIYLHDLKNKLEINFSFQSESVFDTSEGEIVDVSTSFIYNKLSKRIELDRLDVKLGEQSLKLERIKLTRGIKYQATVTFFVRKEKDQKIETVILPRVQPYKFYGFRLPPVERKKFRNFQALRFSNQIRNTIEDFIDEISYIGPLREAPKHLYISGGELRKDVGLKGEYASDVLWSQSQRTKYRNSLLKKVNKWVNLFGLGDVEIKLLGKHSGFFQILITNPATKISATISDVGFGVSQLLPLIVEGFYSAPGSTLLVEQPEIHLHPKVQTDLADLLIEFYYRKEENYC